MPDYMSGQFELTEHNSSDEQISLGNKIDIVQMKYLSVQSISWEELFAGYDKMFAITYSSGMGFIHQLLKKFEYAEIIFGCEEVMAYNLQELLAYQLKTIERLRATSSDAKVDLISKIDNNNLRLYVSRKKLSHEKIYLLESQDGRKRVIMGSANMSYSAFTGKQRENICFLDDEEAFEWYKSCFENLKENCTDDITASALAVADIAENLQEIPVMHTLNVRKAMVIQPEVDNNDEIRFVLDIKNMANGMAPYMPKTDKKGKIILSPEIAIQTRRKLADAVVQEKELRNEFPQLVVDTVFSEAALNDKKIDLKPLANEVKNDVNLFIEYMEGYNKFHGDIVGMQLKYYAFAVWFFTTPFMASMRNMAVRNNHNLLPYPVFGLIYGQSKAGKTTFLETLLKMMIGQKTKMTAPDFTRSSIDTLKRSVKGAPIIVDDLTQARFIQHATETIKNDDFGVFDNLCTYPAVVISANEDVKAVAPEIIRRTVICNVNAGLKNTELMKTSTVRRVQKNIGTALYREYLRRMLGVMPDLLDALKTDDKEEAPDILEISSMIIHEIVVEFASVKVPPYIRTLTLDDYFGDRVTGAQAIKKIETAWQVNRKAFRVDKKHSEVRYNTGQSWEAGNIMKELPEDLEARRSREWIVMDLDKACEFFKINFRKSRNLFDMFSG